MIPIRNKPINKPFNSTDVDLFSRDITDAKFDSFFA